MLSEKRPCNFAPASTTPGAALRMAAAFIAADGRSSWLDVVTLDDRLVIAKRVEKDSW